MSDRSGRFTTFSANCVAIFGKYECFSVFESVDCGRLFVQDTSVPANVFRNSSQLSLEKLFTGTFMFPTSAEGIGGRKGRALGSPFE
jgi:hypothetical protein